MAPAGLPVGPVDLHDLVVVGGEPAGQPGGVAAGALDPKPLHLAKALRPALQLVVAAQGRGRLGGTQDAAELVDRGGDVDVLVAVDPDGDQALGLWHGGHVVPFQLV